MGHNGCVARSGSPHAREPRRGKRRSWASPDGGSQDGTGSQGGTGSQDGAGSQGGTGSLGGTGSQGNTGSQGGATAPQPPGWGERRPDARPVPPPYQPTVRRRYPWHDDPDYDPAEYHRDPTPPQAWRPTGPASAAAPGGHPAGDPRPEIDWASETVREQPRRPAPPQPRETQARETQARDTQPRDTPPETPAEDDGPTEPRRPAGPRTPRKLTVTRVAAMRSRQFAERGVRTFHRAATADGADRSGLTALTYATMMTYAVDAAVTVALANTLFFAAASAESKSNVALYLAITVAPFAVVAPVIGPLLDRLQRGRRAALAVSFAGRAVLAVVMALNYENWLLYPAALGTMVLSKSYMVLKAAVTPRVLPETITLTTTNSRLTTFGLVAGGVFGGVAGGVAWMFGSSGALYYTAALAVVGVWLCVRIPRWVEVTAGEVPAALRTTRRGKRRPMGRGVVTALWGNASIRILTGFLALFVAFVVKEQTEHDPSRQLFLIGIVGAAAGIGGFVGNAAGARSAFGHADTVVVSCIGGVVCSTVVAAIIPGIMTAAIVGLVGSTASALSKVCLDAVVQRDLPEESRASAFGRSETVLQLAWVFGGALGVLLPHSTFWIGFVVISVVVALAGIQTTMVSRGRTLVPGLGARDPRVDSRPMAPTPR
ncbi:MFS transporter [Pseudonocardia dioxanivorans]|uniref:MFS transporter n=1 Tax=Pseudonocardia dioxanivorans TaxID=240495 RepID=UPI000CD2E524|nr:MFS transporter [Pseudonocardia dioxanivorans]